MLKFPKISCVTVTAGRVELIKKSIYCYTQQTYKNKELIIVSQGTSDQNTEIRTFIDSLSREDIIFVEASDRLSLGAMRNLSVEIATAPIICQWDDDDLYHPHRLMAQYHAILGNGVVASIYDQHLKWFVEIDEMYWCDWSIEQPQWRTFLCGSIMFYRNLFHQFDNLLYPEEGEQSDREEDMNVLIKFSRIGKLAPVKYGHHYIYTYHGNNVYDLNHHKLVLKKRVFREDELMLHKDLLIKTFDLVGVDRYVRVKSLDDVAFEYRSEIIKED